jgi:hypothetical protein
MKKIQTHKTPTSNPLVPQCPELHGSMYYSAERGTWVCRKVGCNLIARHKDDVIRKKLIKKIDNLDKSSFIKSKINQFSKSITLYICEVDGEDSPQFIVSVKDEAHGDVFTDVSNHIDTVLDVYTDEVTLCLTFKDIKRFDFRDD